MRFSDEYAVPGVAALFFVLFAALASCGTAQSITSAAACNSLIISIGEARQLAPERAVADIRTVSAVGRRLQDAPDAGAVDGGHDAE